MHIRISYPISVICMYITFAYMCILFVYMYTHVGECCSVEASLGSLHHCLQSVCGTDRGHHVWREYRWIGSVQSS